MSYSDEHKYDDIINMPHHVSKKRPQMSPLDRAALFSPFAALTGHEDAITEASRTTEKRIDLDENSIEILNEKMKILKEKLAEKPVISFTYFKPDEKKDGGAYLTVTGIVKKIDEYKHILFLEEGQSILFRDLVSIDGNIFDEIIL